MSPVTFAAPLTRYQHERLLLGRYCPACGAVPGKRCDGSLIQTYDGWHFARDPSFQWPPRSEGNA